MHKELTDAGIFPQQVKLDNEASSEMIKTIKIKNISFQLAPTRDHQTNPAERSIRTFKDHFIATIFGIDEKYPGNQWCRLIKPITKTLRAGLILGETLVDTFSMLCTQTCISVVNLIRASFRFF